VNKKLLFFHAKWCSSCKVLEPKLSKWIEEKGIDYESIDVEEDPDKAVQFKVMTLPLVVFMNGDQQTCRLVAPELDRIKHLWEYESE